MLNDNGRRQKPSAEFFKMAESQGFEPRIPFITGYTISSRAPSAARPTLR
jgi:hypothetical protein